MIHGLDEGAPVIVLLDIRFLDYRLPLFLQLSVSRKRPDGSLASFVVPAHQPDGKIVRLFQPFKVLVGSVICRQAPAGAFHQYPGPCLPLQDLLVEGIVRGTPAVPCQEDRLPVKRGFGGCRPEKQEVSGRQARRDRRQGDRRNQNSLVFQETHCFFSSLDL